MSQHGNLTNFEDMEEIKLILLGEAGCGKSCIISRYTLDKFDSNYFTTFSNTFISKEFEYKGKKYNINIWDTVGQEKFRSLTKIFIKDTKICLLVYDITNMHSFEEIKNYWLDQVRQIADKDLILGLAGNKNDLIINQKVDDKLAINFAKENNIIFGLTSAAKDKSSIDQLIDSLIVKFIESKNPSLSSNKTEENRIKLNNNNVEKKKNSCSFLELTKNLFKLIKKEEIKKEEKELWSFISIPNDKNATEKIKICIVGNEKVGKTNLCQLLLNEKYINNQNEQKENIKYNKTLCYNDNYFDAEIYDFTSEGDSKLIKNSDIIICLYVLNDENSYNELLNYWYPFILKNNENKNTIIGICENKNDLKNQSGLQFEVDIEKSNNEIKKALNIDNDIIFEKISCKTNLNVNKFIQRVLSKFIEIKKINKI